MRYDIIWIVGTIPKRTRFSERIANYRLLTNEPRNLKQHEFAYKLRIPIDTDDWKERILEVSLAQIIPSALNPPEQQGSAAKSTPEQVLDRMKGGGTA